MAKLGSVCRRVYRIFSHAYFHHRTLFDEYEVRKTTEFEIQKMRLVIIFCCIIFLERDSPVPSVHHVRHEVQSHVQGKLDCSHV